MADLRHFAGTNCSNSAADGPNNVSNDRRAHNVADASSYLGGPDQRAYANPNLEPHSCAHKRAHLCADFHPNEVSAIGRPIWFSRDVNATVAHEQYHNCVCV